MRKLYYVGRYLVLCFLILLSLPSRAQEVITNDLLLQKLENHARANPSDILFVHTDKTLYTNNETIWFSAYLIPGSGEQLKAHSYLSVSLAREDTREIALQEQYLLNNGLSFGSIALPDSIPPGNYRFLASTNVLHKNGKPGVLFEQPLTIKSITQPEFTFTADLLDTAITNGNLRALVNVSVKDPKDKSKPTLEYSIGKDKSQPIVLKDKTYVINIPAAKLQQDQPMLLAAVSFKNGKQYLSLKLPEIQSRGIHIRFFPEGGNLSSGLPSIVAWEARTRSGQPLAVEGVLFKDEQPIDTIRTNSIGIGKFRIRPDRENKYTLRLAANSYLQKDTLYQLPEILEDGLVLNLANAVVRDSLRLTLYSKEPKFVSVLIHNYRIGSSPFRVLAKPSGGTVKAALAALPKGLFTLTVLDENSKPVAERLFFAHHNNRLMPAIEPDKDVYARKENVTIKLQLKDPQGTPVKSLLSVAVVQDNRIERTKFRDIETYAYLNHSLGDFEPDPTGRGFENKEFLEDLLRVKGWRRYTWQSLVSSNATDTPSLTSTPILARLKLRGKPLKKPQSLNILRDSLLQTFETAADGSIVFTPGQLSITEGRKIIVTVNQNNKEGYTLEIDDPFIAVHEKLAGEFEVRHTGLALRGQSTSDQQLKGMERMIALQEVVVETNKADNSLFGADRNACGDYVCMYNILNCPNHFGAASSRAPVPGKSYRTPVGGITTYIKCNADDGSDFLKIKGVYLAREFYGVPTDAVSLQEPQFLSTLFWRPGVITDKQGKTEFSFYTGDITGTFRIVVQGMGTTDLAYGENSFIVK